MHIVENSSDINIKFSSQDISRNICLKNRANHALNNLNLKPTCDTIEREWKISKLIAGFQPNFHLRQISLQKKNIWT